MTRASFCLLLAALLTAPAWGLAHEGHIHKTMGTLTVVHDLHIEMKDLKGVVSSHTMDDKTKIRRGTTILTAADLKVGDRVVVSTLETKDKATGKVTKRVTEVQVGASTATKR